MKWEPPQPEHIEREFTVSPFLANVLGFLVSIIAAAPFIALHLHLHQLSDWQSIFSSRSRFIFYAVLILSFVAHEWLHGAGFLRGGASRRHVRFGFFLKTFTPYAHCTQPLPARAYRRAVALPGIVLGFVPAMIGIISGLHMLTLLGVIGIVGAGGDIVILLLLWSVPADRLLVDHPSRVGCYIPRADADLPEEVPHASSFLQRVKDFFIGVAVITALVISVALIVLLVKRRLIKTITCIHRGNTYRDKGEYDGAIKDYDKAIELSPKNARAYNNRGNTYRDKGEYDRAIRDYNKAIELNPEFTAVYINRGIAYHDKGEYDRAIRDYDKVIELNPEYAVAYNNRGFNYNEKGEYDRAIRDYNKAIELDPENEYPVKNLGGVYFQQGKLSLALKKLNEALNMKEKSNSFNYVYRMKILIYKERGNRDFLEITLKEAERYIKNQSDKYPKKPSNYLTLAEIYCEAGKNINEAEELTRKGGKLQKGYYPHYVRGRVCLAKGENKKAVDEFEKALELNPSHTLTCYWLGKTYFKRLKDKQKAEYYYKKGLKTNPNYRLIKEALRRIG
ncbi:MAG: tetratricopeptide repeat protein [bacterium]